MLGNLLKNFSWIVFYVTPSAAFHTGWIASQNHAVGNRVLNRALNPKSRMIPDQIQVRCDYKTIYKSAVYFWLQQSSRYIVYLGKYYKIKRKTNRFNHFALQDTVMV